MLQDCKFFLNEQFMENRKRYRRINTPHVSYVKIALYGNQYIPYGNQGTSPKVLVYDTGRARFNSNTVNSKFHLIRSFFEIFARFLSFHV